MFRHVGRRLAIFNTLIVIALIAVIGLLTYGALRRSLEREVDSALEERIAVALSGSLSDATANTARIATREEEEDEDDDEDDEDEEHEDEEHEEDREIVTSGDTILIRVGPDGDIVENPRDITLPNLPVESGVERALDARVDVRSVTLSDGEHVRVMTAPIVDDGRVTGAVQAIRSLDEHEEQLETVRNMTVLGVGLGFLIAGPAGYYLSRRAMVPINAAFSRQRAFVADASHELRTPLTLIRANAEFIRRKPERPVSEVLPSLDNIIREVDSMASLVSDLLTLARLDAGRLELELESRDIAAIAGTAIESLRPLADGAGVALRLDAGQPAMAAVDPARIEQVLRNLVDNAIRHTPPGGEVVVRVGIDGAWHEIEVRDTGSGISPDELPHVFERFSRPDRARNREHGGAGLGLAIARGLIEEHAGTIQIESRPGVGTVVRVRLPAASDQ